MATALRVLLSRLLGPFRQRRFDLEMDEEFRSHLEMLADRFIDQGMTRDEALRAARRQFGGTTQLKERLREQNSSAFLDSLWMDTRYALRQIRKSPGFAATAVLTLAIGIGANTGLFMLVDTLLLRPVPVQDPSSLYQVFGQLSDRTSLGGFSPREYQAVLSNSDVFSQVIADTEVRARNRNRAMGGYA